MGSLREDCIITCLEQAVALLDTLKHDCQCFDDIFRRQSLQKIKATKALLSVMEALLED